MKTPQEHIDAIRNQDGHITVATLNLLADYARSYGYNEAMTLMLTKEVNLKEIASPPADSPEPH